MLKKFNLWVTLFLLISQISVSQKTELWYNQPATQWEEALPVGNGKLGAMIYGGIENEQIQFNEETLWTGEPRSYANPGSWKYLSQIRQLLNDNQQKEAERIAELHFMSIPKRQMAYQAFGDLHLTFQNHQEAKNYRRSLDLNDGTVSIDYQIDKVKYNRKIFASNPANAIFYHISADQKRSLNFSIDANSNHSIKSLVVNKQEIILKVKVEKGVLEGVARVKIKTDGKIVKESNRLTVKNASQATITLVAATNFLDYENTSNEPEIITAETLKNIPDFEKAQTEHIADYQNLYNRFDLKLPKVAASSLPTNERLKHFESAPNDPDLLALYVQYARYLLISSSREGSQPANLQGIWNHSLQPPWDSKLTVNINTEMNYWPAELTNLSECHEPLFQMIKDVSKTGTTVAREHYNASGWVLHHNTDLWRGAAPINAANHGIWPTGGAWLVLHLWERYLFTKDLDFLAETAYPLIKGSAEFFTEFLYKDPKTGWLISTPSHSPEHGGLVAGPAMDHQIIRRLFKVCIASAELLKKDVEFVTKLRDMLENIAPDQIGRYRQLQEWLEDVDDTTNHHRHVSHLWGVYPGIEINSSTPATFNAARQSLLYRTDEGTGWSLAWKINLWARFLDGNRAYSLVERLLKPVKIINNRETPGSYPNLFDAHPPFQIDGNFGGAAGIIELLLQSHLNEIHLLPALPSKISEGTINGVRARNGFELNYSWKDGKLTQLTILSLAGQECKIRYQNKTISFPTVSGSRYHLNGNLDLQLRP